jgi:O-antigen/teichoic acid export membrane protein
MDKSKDSRIVITNGTLITTIGLASSLLFYPILRHYKVLEGLLNYFYILLVLQSFQSLLSQYTRAIDKIKSFALNGILQTMVTGISNIFFLVFLNYGINGYFISLILANLFSIIYLMYSVNYFSCFSPSNINKEMSISMIRYSIPLIPNSFMWWLLNASNRYFILFYVGLKENGLFAVANKIPSIISVFTTIFTQAWQLSAIDEYQSDSNEDFYSKIFEIYKVFIFICVSAVLVLCKYFIKTLFAAEYYISWKYIPFLLLAVAYSSFSGFLGMNYIAAKETGGVFKTSLAGGLFSLVLNFILVPVMGALGSSITTMLSFMVMYVFRLKDTQKYINVKENKLNTLFDLGIVFMQTYVMYLELNMLVEIIFLSLLFLLLIIVNIKLIINFIKRVIH